MNRPTITAHTGCDGAADGSMAAIELGIGLGADLVEVDVRRVPGLGLALSHDAPADPSGLVPLAEAFREVARHPAVGINCDLKQHGLARDVMALAADCGLRPGQLAFSGSLSPGELMADPSIARVARVYLNIEGAVGALDPVGDEYGRLVGPLADLCARLRVRALNLPPVPAIRPFLPRLGEAGVRISAWTINDPADMRALLAEPWLDNLTTRRAALAVSVRAELDDQGRGEP